MTRTEDDKRWAAVMGIGLAVAVVVGRVAIFSSTLAMFGDALGADGGQSARVELPQRAAQ